MRDLNAAPFEQWWQNNSQRLSNYDPMAIAWNTWQAARASEGGEAVGAVNKTSTGEYEFFPGSALADMPNGIHRLYASPSAGAMPEVGPRHPEVIRWRNDGIEASAKIADAYGWTDTAEDIRKMLAAAPAAPAASCACDESGMCKFHGDQAEKFCHPHNGEQGGEWVSVGERLPTEADADSEGNVWTRVAAHNEVAAFPPSIVQVFSEDGKITHWMPTGLKRPNPPTERRNQ